MYQIIRTYQFPKSYHVRVTGNQVELVLKFFYLGFHIEVDGGIGPEVKRRIAIAWDCMSSLQWAIRKNNIGLHTKLSMINTYMYILLVLLCRKETWTLTKDLETRVDALQRWFLKRILLISYTAHATNAEKTTQRSTFQCWRWFIQGGFCCVDTLRAA